MRRTLASGFCSRLLLPAAPAIAHHGFDTDTTPPEVPLTGVVTKGGLNPHMGLFAMYRCEREGDDVEHEMTSPNTVRRQVGAERSPPREVSSPPTRQGRGDQGSLVAIKK